MVPLHPSPSAAQCTPTGHYWRITKIILDEVMPGDIFPGIGLGNACVGHGLALALSLFGYGVESVECMGSHPQPDPKDWRPASSKYHLEHLLLHYPDGRQIILMNAGHRTENHDFHASAYSTEGVLHSPGIGVQKFPSGSRKIIEMFLKLVQTGQPQVPYEHSLELIAIIEAGRIAQAKGGRISLQEVPGYKS